MITAIKTYPKYKDSAIEWVKSIPYDWDIKPLRDCCSENFQKNLKLLINDVLSLSYGNIILKDIDKNFGLVPESYSSYQILYPGDIVMRLTDLQNDHVSLRTGLVKNKGIITSAYLGLKIHKNKLNDRFFHWLLHSYDLQKVFYAMGGGIRQTVGYDDLKWLPILIPSSETQKNIADFLDTKTKTIDELIIKKERMVNLLQEKRMVLISNTVTKGVASEVKMKPSSIEWLQLIPEKWEARKLKYISKIDTGGIFGDEILGDVEAKLVTTGQLSMSGEWYLEKMDTRFFRNDEYKKYKNIYGDIVVVKSSGSSSNIVSGKAGFVSEKEVGTVFGNFLLRIRATNIIDSKFL